MVNLFNYIKQLSTTAKEAINDLAKLLSKDCGNDFELTFTANEFESGVRLYFTSSDARQTVRKLPLRISKPKPPNPFRFYGETH